MLHSPIANTCFINYFNWNNTGTAQMCHMRLTFHIYFQNAFNQPTHFISEIYRQDMCFLNKHFIKTFTLRISVNIILVGNSEISMQLCYGRIKIFFLHMESFSSSEPSYHQYWWSIYGFRKKYISKDLDPLLSVMNPVLCKVNNRMLYFKVLG